MCNMISVMAFAVAALATARITRLITTDYLTATPRAWLINRLGTSSKLSYLLACPWCTSMWIAAAAAPVFYWWQSSAWVQVPAVALALSQTVGMVSRVGEDD
jgi:hypothetical protein